MHADAVRFIPGLLHDAVLTGGSHDVETGVLQLTYDCLRRHEDGSSMTDRTVTLHVEGVTSVTAAYDTRRPETRPSAFRLPEEERITGLAPWPLPPMEVVLDIDSARSAESVAFAAHREVLLPARGEDGAHLVVLHVEDRGSATPTILAIRCAGVRPFVGGQPFALERWEREHAAWWKGWAEHWSEEDEDVAEQEDEVADEDTVIPAGDNAPLDKSYVPPSHPAFTSPPTDAPESLVAPIRTWFEAGLELDAAKRVGVAPDLDSTPQDQIAAEQASMENDEYGSWAYAREVDAWWIEGDRAFVGIVGVTHRIPMEGDPAEDRLTRWSFALRRRAGIWQVHEYTWADDDALAQRPWARRWRDANASATWS